MRMTAARHPAQRYPLVVWVDGNHEAYKHGADIAGSATEAAGAHADCSACAGLFAAARAVRPRVTIIKHPHHACALVASRLRR
jgi:hypothetical protein